MQPIILHKPTSTSLESFCFLSCQKEWLVCPEAHFSAFQADISTFWGAEAEAGKGDGTSWRYSKETQREEEENHRLKTSHVRAFLEHSLMC